APAESEESVLEDRQHECYPGQCWHGNSCVPCGSGGGIHCPQGLVWDGNNCVGPGAG
ncbi:unnamed protein product, partial [Allacma fusca]